MSAIDELRSYVDQLQRRFRLAAVARGAAIITAAALIATLVLVVIINKFAFSTMSLWSARALLLLTLVLGTVFGLAVPLWRLGQRWWTRRAEQAFPEFGQRLMTFADRDGKSSDPFLDLLAADTLRVARGTDLKSAAPDAMLLGLFAVGVVCLGSLVWLIRSGPGYLGYGAAALWTGPPSEPLYEVRVAPGDATVRRHADQLVTAELRGLQREQLKIHVRYQRATQWEETTMQPRPAASGFQFLFAGVPEDVEYFIDAGSVQSPRFHLRVADIPAVKQIRVTYHHPDWTRLPDAVEERGGDLRAVEGTEAKLEITTDRPMSAGSLALDDGREIKLTPGPRANVYQGVIKLEKDGAYHVAARDRAEVLRISDDYFIEASPVKPPEVALVRPERDYRASPIEEVTLTAKAEDPFGLSELALHYSVNGGPEKTLPLMKDAGAHKASGTATIALESLKLVPGDVVAIYAAAKDARGEAKTNISFVQIDPFEREFSQSQSGGGGAGGGGSMANDQAQIAEREKEIIAATWTQNSQKNAAAKQAAEQSKFLADVQTTLRGQSLSLAGRLGMRDLQSQNEQFSSFQQEMAAAASAMDPAAKKLSDQQWAAAVTDEQKALQHLLRAEATFRQIQVAFNSRGGGGGGAVNSAGRDLASLFDLELDTQKNMYESPQTPFSANKRDQEIEDALRKLDELARRQGELAAQRQNDGEQSAEERWQQEMLRRKAEELQQQVEQLAKNSSQSGQQGQQGSPGQSGQSGQRGQSGQSGQSARRDPSDQSGSSGANGGDSSQSSSVRQALNRLRQAEDDMRRAVDQHNSMDARRAAERLREAMGLLAGLQQQDVSHKLDSLGQQVADLQERQSEQSERMRQLRTTRSTSSLAGRGGLPGLIDDRQKLADDLARITRDMHAAQRQADERSRTAAGKLHEALNDLETADTETRLQRSADMLRRGYAPLNDDVETQVSTDLKHLREQLGDARTAAADGKKDGSDDALDTVDRLRSRLAALDQSLRRNAGQQGAQQGGQNGGQQAGNGSQPGGAQPGGNQAGGNPNGRGPVAGGQIGRGADGGRLTGTVGGVVGGGGGAYRGGYVDGAWNAGNNGFDPRLPHRVGPENNNDSIAVGPQTRQAYQAGVDELNRLRRAVGEDEQARKEVDELIRSMQRLDPKRFPGNPAMVEDLYAKVLSGVDKLELQLRHAPDQVRPGEVRSANPAPMPAGYQGAVADYFRRLSANP